MQTGLTIGLDLGDRASCWCALNDKAVLVARGEALIQKQPLELFFRLILAFKRLEA